MTPSLDAQLTALAVPVEVAFWLHGFIALTAILFAAGLCALRLLGRKPSLPLLGLLVLFAVQALGNIAYQLANPGWEPQFGWFVDLLELRAIVGFVFGPLALFYVREFVDPTSSLKPHDAWHAVPALVMAMTLYVWPAWDINIYAYASAGMLLVYAGLAWREVSVSGYLKYGGADRRIWLLLSATLLLLLLGVNAVATNFNCRPISDPVVRLYQAMLLTGILILIYGFFIAGLWRAFVLFPREASFQTSKADRQLARPDTALVDSFLVVLDGEMGWRSPDVSLGSFAERLQVSPRRLSLAVREQLGLGIVELVNARRVEAVKAAIDGDPDSQRSLLDIALEAGFNSKPSFNRAFLKHTGMTPSVYRKSLARDR